MRDKSVISVGLRIVWEFGWSIVGLSGRYLYVYDQCGHIIRIYQIKLSVATNRTARFLHLVRPGLRPTSHTTRAPNASKWDLLLSMGVFTLHASSPTRTTGHVAVNWSARTDRKQHSRICFQFLVQICLCVLCEWDRKAFTPDTNWHNQFLWICQQIDNNSLSNSPWIANSKRLRPLHTRH